LAGGLPDRNSRLDEPRRPGAPTAIQAQSTAARYSPATGCALAAPGEQDDAELLYCLDGSFTDDGKTYGKGTYLLLPATSAGMT